MKKLRPLCLLTCILCLMLSGCSRNPMPFSKSGIYFDTIITITVYDSSHLTYLNECFAMAERYENLFSKTIETSDVYKINHSNGTKTIVDPETFYLIEKAVSYAQMSNGIIDPTILPLSDLWGFGKNKPFPSTEDISVALSYVGYDAIHLNKDDCSVTLTNKNAGIDLGFIAKGYIADKMKEYLLSQGVESALINLGGNVLPVGTKPDGTAYILGIQVPFDKKELSIPNVSVNDQSLVTSGIYERYFYHDGILYHHILDTSNGRPIRNDLWSVTILSDSSMEGDVYSTLCMCLGLNDGMKLIEQTEGLEAMFITEDMKMHYSSGFPK